MKAGNAQASESTCSEQKEFWKAPKRTAARDCKCGVDPGGVGVSPSSRGPQGRGKKAQVSIQEGLTPQPLPPFEPCKWAAEGTCKERSSLVNPGVGPDTPGESPSPGGQPRPPRGPRTPLGRWPRAERKARGRSPPVASASSFARGQTQAPPTPPPPPRPDVVRSLVYSGQAATPNSAGGR